MLMRNSQVQVHHIISRSTQRRFNMLFVQGLNDPSVNGAGRGRGGANKVEELFKSNILITILVEVSQQSFKFLTPTIWEIR